MKQLAHFAALVILVACQGVHAAQDSAPLRLYAADCGSIEFKDLSRFSDAGDYDGKAGRIVDPCFIIRHPKGTLLWDTGIGDDHVGKPAVTNGEGLTVRVEKRLIDQLRMLGLTPADIQYVAFSHFHSDHTGNSNLFTKATWILNENELRWALQSKPPYFVEPETFNQYQHVTQKVIAADYDVFGDGKVVILKTPGHTPGHQSLLVKLEHAGTVVISGDLYHFRTDRSPDNIFASRTMAMNVSRADTFASFARVENILRVNHGRLVIQHDPNDFQALPKFPEALD